MKKIYLFVFLLFPLMAHAVQVQIEQKLVIVKGDKSFLMGGDAYRSTYNKPKGYSRDSVLPALLSVGWRIKSIHVNDASVDGIISGYVLIVRKEI